jgi:dUTP pyrophosphatase
VIGPQRWSPKSLAAVKAEISQIRMELIRPMELKVKRLTTTAKLPTKAYDDPAGFDLYADADVELETGKPVAIPTGIATAFPTGYVALVWDRAGMGSRGIHRLAGVIDSDYRGEWRIVLINLNQPGPGLTHSLHVKRGDKIAQVIFQKFENWPIVEVAELDDTLRGSQGFGSSGG